MKNLCLWAVYFSFACLTSACLGASDYGGLISVCGTVRSGGQPVSGPAIFHVKGHGKDGQTFDSTVSEDTQGQPTMSTEAYTVLDKNGHGCIDFWAIYKNSYKSPNVVILDALAAQVDAGTVGGKVVSFTAPSPENASSPVLTIEADFDLDHPEDSPGTTEFDLK